MIWIMVGVILFASLSYVVAQNMRSGGEETLGREMARNYATQILQSAASIKRAVQTVRIEGYDETEVSFENNYTAANYTNANCGLDECKVFNPYGGSVNYVTPNAEWLDVTQDAQAGYGDWLFSGDADVKGVGGTDPELILYLPFISKQICAEINDKLGYDNDSGNPPQETDSFGTAIFTGSYTGGDDIENLASNEGKVAGCVRGNVAPTSSQYYFFQVLLAR